MADYFARGALRAGCGAVVVVNLLLVGRLHAAEDMSKASTSNAAKADALKAIPLVKLTPLQRTLVNGVTSNASLYRRLPQQTIDCEPDLCLFLIRNPEMVVNMWATMGITKMAMERVNENTFRVTDGEGTKGTVQVVHQSDDVHLIYSEGSYSGSMYPRTVRGKCILLLRTDFQQTQDGRMKATNTLDMFLEIENLGVEILAKTFAPSVGKSADHNFAETSNFVSKFSRTAETNEEGVVRLIDRIQRVDADRKNEFKQLAVQVDDKLIAAKRFSDLQRNPQAIPLQGTRISRVPPKE